MIIGRNLVIPCEYHFHGDRFSCQWLKGKLILWIGTLLTNLKALNSSHHFVEQYTISCYFLLIIFNLCMTITINIYTTIYILRIIVPISKTVKKFSITKQQAFALKITHHLIESPGIKRVIGIVDESFPGSGFNFRTREKQANFA